MKRMRVVWGIMMLAGMTAAGFAGVWSQVNGNTAVIHHDNAFFNCCPDMVFEINQDGFTIDIFEIDLGTHPCGCMCYFDFTHVIDGLSPGHYTVNVWEQNEIAGTTSFDIAEQIGSYSTTTMMSECHDAVGEDPPDQSDVLEIDNASTRPVKTQASLRYHLPSACQVYLKIYNVTGQEVRALDVGYQNPGDHLVVWDTRDEEGNRVPRGIYFVRLHAGDQVRSLPVTVLR